MSAPSNSLVGVVVSCRMQRAVKVRIAQQVYNKFLRKNFPGHKNHLVSDPNSSLRVGDVVRIEDAGRQLSRHIKHVVAEIVKPWGPPIEERPPVLSKEERYNAWKEKYDAKIARRAAANQTDQAEDVEGKEQVGNREGSREARSQMTDPTDVMGTQREVGSTIAS